MTLQEAQKKVAELKKALLEAEKELEALQLEEKLALPAGFEIFSYFYSGSYVRYLELKYEGVTVSLHSPADLDGEIKLSEKAREFAEFYKKVKSI